MAATSHSNNSMFDSYKCNADNTTYLNCNKSGDNKVRGVLRLVGGSPGLVVMGGDSHSRGREFESQHRILDGHF